MNVPRYPTLRARLHSHSAPIPCWGIAQLGPEPADVREAGSALRTVALRRPPPDPRGLVDPGSDLPPEERWMMAISGGVREREGGLCEGSPDELAAQIVANLEQGGFLGLPADRSGRFRLQAGPAGRRGWNPRGGASVEQTKYDD